MNKFAAVTVHAVVDGDDGLELLSRCLAVIPIAKSHTWYNLAEAIATRLATAMPPSALLIATKTDNGANFVKMARALHTNADRAAIEGMGKDDWDEPINDDYEVDDGLPADEMLGSLRCIAHKAQLAVLDTCKADRDAGPLASVMRTIDQVRGVITKIRGSTELRNLFRETTAELKQPDRMVVLDCETRWSSTHAMLKSFDDK